jgi:hypothetical protein
VIRTAESPTTALYSLPFRRGTISQQVDRCRGVGAKSDSGWMGLVRANPQTEAYAHSVVYIPPKAPCLSGGGDQIHCGPPRPCNRSGSELTRRAASALETEAAIGQIAGLRPGHRSADTRRDFLNGASLAVAGSLLPPGWNASASSAEYATHEGVGHYPPLSTGMRGSHPGSFEVANQVRDGAQGAFGNIGDTNERYDLVVVEGGISGLAAPRQGQCCPQSSQLH